MSGRVWSKGKIAELVGGRWVGDAPGAEETVARVAGLEGATADAVVFAGDERTLEQAIGSQAGLILVGERAWKGMGGAGAVGTLKSAGTVDSRLLVVKDARFAFALCGRALREERTVSEVDPSAVVDASARLGERVKIGARAVIEAGVILGDDVEVAAGAVILEGVEVGSRVVVQAGAVLGATGFGYARNPETGEHLLFPQQGRLVIEDDVEIGANTTIDRGALGETRIGKGTKIDDQVHIGHNCRIGKNVLMASQVGISGSCVVEDGAVLAGQVGLGDHVHIGPGVILGGASGVFPGKHLVGPGQMFMGVPAEPLKEYLKTVARMRRLRDRD
ncbi:MAG: UDP-3-O-(3-hydroxymyristoyl)glucosamine N-acyltransferase [Acidobacteriaceae bacterium]